MEVQTKMNETLCKISTWVTLNKPSLNTDKAVYIEFGNPVGSAPKKHIGYIYNKTKYLIFIYYKLSKFMTTDTLRMVYYTLSHSIMIAWGGRLKSKELIATYI